MVKIINTVLGVLVCIGLPALAWIKLSPTHGPWLALLFAVVVGIVCLLAMVAVLSLFKTFFPADTKTPAKTKRGNHGKP